MPTPAVLALEDGQVYEGRAFGAIGEACGEIVFNTSMTGYQEVITDPSYRGQIVAMTYPLIGNYGVNEEDVESHRPWLEGFVVKELSRTTSNWRATRGLDEYLRDAGVPGIEGVDTRAVTKHIRTAGAMRAVLSSADPDPKRAVEKARTSPGLEGRDLIREVTCAKPWDWDCGGVPRLSGKGGMPTPPLRGHASGEGENMPSERRAGHATPGNVAVPESLGTPDCGSATGPKVVVMDYGVKYGILRRLAELGCRVRVLPAGATYEDVAAEEPDGVVLSNGPGDPSAVPYAVATVRQLIEKPPGGRPLPLFGICMGHQIMGQALGGKTFKLKFGHHGANHPTKDLRTSKVDITVQNHGFCVDIESLAGRDMEVTHLNLNDQTLEGMQHTRLPVFSVQFHPEASPGPHDSQYLFRRFFDFVRGGHAQA